MRVLLDTHVLLWWFDGDKRLSKPVRRLLEDDTSEVWVSAATVWEVATKSRLGKLPKAEKFALQLPKAIAEQGFNTLAMTPTHAHRAGWLAGPHRDPFDRMLAAQALVEDMTLVSSDAIFPTLGVQLFW
jgi:PIN domain nuclease of toxin-antitoxin system